MRLVYMFFLFLVTTCQTISNNYATNGPARQSPVSDVCLFCRVQTKTYASAPNGAMFRWQSNDRPGRYGEGRVWVAEAESQQWKILGCGIARLRSCVGTSLRMWILDEYHHYQ
jgi:hypothetical protein